MLRMEQLNELSSEEEEDRGNSIQIQSKSLRKANSENL